MTAPSTMKPSALVAAAHIIASDGPGEVVRKLDAAFDAAVAPRPWDAEDIKQPNWSHVFSAFVEGAKEARNNPDADEQIFGRAADAHTKRVLEEIDPVSEHALRTGTWGVETAAAPPAVTAQVIENLLQLARIVDRAVEDWGESFADGSCEVKFHKNEADKVEAILEFFDSLPDAPPEEGVIESGPLRAARVLRASAAPAAPAGVVFDMVALVKQLVLEHRVAEPNSLLASQVLGYLKSHGLLDSPLRVHSDDSALDRFALAMRAKLAAARAKGRGGWETCPPEALNRMLHEHLEKGDPRDVANFCMFLWHTGHRTTTPALAAPAVDAETLQRAARYAWLREQHWHNSDIAVVRQPKLAIKPGYDCPSGDRLDEFCDAGRAAQAAATGQSAQ